MLEHLFIAQDYFLKFIIIPILITVGVFTSFKLRWVHIINLTTAIKLLFQSSDVKSRKNMSSFAAFSAILGGNLGVGNISGTAIALSTGGPGSIFWMAVIILLTSIIKYVSCFLGLEYRIKRNNRFIGGPMHFMREGLNSKALPILFCIATILSAITGGNFIQVNSLTLPMEENFGISPIYGGFFISFIVALVILAGLKGFAHIVSNVVPFMATSYILLCLYILIVNSSKIIPAFSLIFSSIFASNNLHGAFVGFAWMQFFSVVQVGASRAIFATDIGVGLEAILHSNVKQKKGHILPLSVEQGLISVLSPFIVLIVCFITALVLIVTNVWASGLDSTNMCFEAFKIGIGSNLAGYFLMIVLFCFAFTTILTWVFCADRSVEYLTNYNSRILKIWRVFFIFIMPLGSVLNVYLAWKFADFAYSLSVTTNLIAIVFLLGTVTRKTKETFA
jgi:AGCS family alanine or glycine:cation symporter